MTNMTTNEWTEQVDDIQQAVEKVLGEDLGYSSDEVYNLVYYTFAHRIFEDGDYTRYTLKKAVLDAEDYHEMGMLAKTVLLEGLEQLLEMHPFEECSDYGEEVDGWEESTLERSTIRTTQPHKDKLSESSKLLAETLKGE